MSGSGPGDTQGPPLSDRSIIAGVVGTSGALIGVIGTSTTNVGVFSFSKTSMGVFVQAANSASYAGAFAGNVHLTDTLTATAKNAVVPFPDGSHRLLRCMESPEHWFEDFGAAKLVRGRAVVKLDADFTK